MESGAEDNFWAVNWPPQEPENYVWEVAGQLNCTGDASGDYDSFQMIECLRGIDWPTLHGTRFSCAVSIVTQ